MKKSKYFISWNDQEITYLLPKSDQTEQIPIENIKALKVKNNEVIVDLANNETKRLNLNSIFYPERKMITDFFDEIDKKLKTRLPM